MDHLRQERHPTGDPTKGARASCVAGAESDCLWHLARGRGGTESLVVECVTQNDTSKRVKVEATGADILCGWTWLSGLFFTDAGAGAGKHASSTCAPHDHGPGRGWWRMNVT